MIVNIKCRGLITTGVDKFYSNGADLKLLWSLEDKYEVNFFRSEAQKLFWRITHFPIPTVAAINGHAFGLGAFIALSHDYRVMRRDKGWISWNEIKNNIQIQSSTINLVSNTKCRGLITTGVDKFYSNGGSLKDEDDVQTYRYEVKSLLWRIAHFPIPTVAAINGKFIHDTMTFQHLNNNGHAFGVGAFIVLSHDYRVMRSDKGWISMNEVKINI
ncbi:hypothetical protein KUTeg_019353 [Tegillarca granosa]|uniref:Uncharacterized protein n=1 Tax=Tegillarca granosa TaxID=220873 RepID=A0ABQ9EGA8_TEGGR|nr:hypothetical protein KUTeg_019353 [Tegillarca granosa]